ncbi:hypothetical protein ACSZOA_00135 [Aeromonas caviae]
MDKNMGQKSASMMLAITSLLAGCAFGPDYTPSEFSTPKHVMGPSSLEVQETRNHVNLQVWWVQFGDLQLTCYITLALQQNLDLAQARARVTQAQAGLGAVDVALLPVGNLSGQAARAYQSVEIPLGQVLNSSPGFDRHGNSYEANLNAS